MYLLLYYIIYIIIIYLSFFNKKSYTILLKLHTIWIIIKKTSIFEMKKWHFLQCKYNYNYFQFLIMNSWFFKICLMKYLFA